MMCLPYNFRPINDNDLLAIYESMMIQLLQRDFDQQNCDSIGKTLRLSTFIKAGTGKALIFPAWDGHGLLFEVGIARAPLQSAALQLLECILEDDIKCYELVYSPHEVV